MVPLSEYFRSVELIWVLWIVSLVLLLWLTRRAFRGFDLGQWRSVFQEEDGAAYSMSYVLVFPIYILLVLLVIECTLILIVKLGTIYAAYAAVRSQIVWYSLAPEPEVTERARRAAIQAMTPYASSWKTHLSRVGTSSTSSEANQYFQAYQAFSGRSGDYRRYIVNKYQWAQWATSINDPPNRKLLKGPGERWNADITVTVTYKMPLHGTAMGRILGSRFNGSGGTIFLVTITSSVTMQDEAAQNQEMSIGVPYDPDR